MRIAYLCSQYPAASHTFIEREVRELRKQGVEIHTFSVRPAGASDRLGTAHQAAARETMVLLENKWRLGAAQVLEFVRAPGRYIVMHFRSQGLAPAGLRMRTRHLAYALEAALLVRALRRKAIDHVHVHFTNNAAFVARCAAWLDEARSYSLSVHGPSDFLNVEADNLGKKLEGAAFVRCISQFCRSQVLAFLPASRWKNVSVVHCGVPAPTEQPARLREKTLRLVSVGRLVAAKGWPILLEACRMLRDRNIDTHLTIVGDGPEKRSLRALAERDSLQDRVTFAGVASPEDVHRYLSEADVFVLASFLEGLPVSYMEAMALGVPVVATRIAGVPELVVDGETGLLVAPGNSTDLANAIARYGNDVALSRRVAVNGRNAIAREFSVEETCRRLKKLFQQRQEQVQ